MSLEHGPKQNTHCGAQHSWNINHIISARNNDKNVIEIDPSGYASFIRLTIFGFQTALFSTLICWFAPELQNFNEFLTLWLFKSQQLYSTSYNYSHRNTNICLLLCRFFSRKHLNIERPFWNWDHIKHVNCAIYDQFDHWN